jgi:class 3 adenylate cyclase
MGVLREYTRHRRVDRRSRGTWSASRRRHDDFFNDPVPSMMRRARGPDGAAIRDCVSEMSRGWAAAGYDLSHGIGIAQGYATLGAIGFEGRWDYGAIGTVTNLAARLCAEAAADQILVSQRVASQVTGVVDLEPTPVLNLRGFHRPVPACIVRG